MLLRCIYAFLAGGALCLIGQVLIDRTNATPAKILVGYVTAGVALSAVGLYKPFADWAGAGASVPLTGFGHTLAEGVRKAKIHRNTDVPIVAQLITKFVALFK